LVKEWVLVPKKRLSAPSPDKTTFTLSPASFAPQYVGKIEGSPSGSSKIEADSRKESKLDSTIISLWSVPKYPATILEYGSSLYLFKWKPTLKVFYLL
jgi:hypothetical protein